MQGRGIVTANKPSPQGEMGEMGEMEDALGLYKVGTGNKPQEYPKVTLMKFPVISGLMSSHPMPWTAVCFI